MTVQILSGDIETGETLNQPDATVATTEHPTTEQ